MSEYADLTAWIQTLKDASDGTVMTEPALDEVADEIFMYESANVPVKTGALRDGIHIESQPGERFIGPRHEVTPYDVFVKEGTRPHIIKPKLPGGTLAFTINGKKVFAKEVRHPGTQPNPFDAVSLTQWQDTLAENVQDKVVRKISGQ